MIQTKNKTELKLEELTKTFPVYAQMHEDTSDDFGAFDGISYHINEDDLEKYNDTDYERLSMPAGRPGIVDVDAEFYKKLEENRPGINIGWNGPNYTQSGLMLIQAEKIAREFHKDQKRKYTGEPYSIHLEAVVKLVDSHIRQYDKRIKSKAIAWLHDIVEDTDVTLEMLSNHFPEEIVSGVNYLTRNIPRDKYKSRLSTAPEDIILIKLCDTEHNTETLSQLTEQGRKRKVDDCRDFYIPLALKLDYPDIAKNLSKNIQAYLN